VTWLLPFIVKRWFIMAHFGSRGACTNK